MIYTTKSFAPKDDKVVLRLMKQRTWTIGKFKFVLMTYENVISHPIHVELGDGKP
jgi:hypothetical protein